MNISIEAQQNRPHERNLNMAVDTDERIAFEEDHKCCITGIGRLPTCMPLISRLHKIKKTIFTMEMALKRSFIVLQNLMVSDVKFKKNKLKLLFLKAAVKKEAGGDEKLVFFFLALTMLK